MAELLQERTVEDIVQRKKTLLARGVEKDNPEWVKLSQLQMELSKASEPAYRKSLQQTGSRGPGSSHLRAASKNDSREETQMNKIYERISKILREAISNGNDNGPSAEEVSNERNPSAEEISGEGPPKPQRVKDLAKYLKKNPKKPPEANEEVEIKKNFPHEDPTLGNPPKKTTPLTRKERQKMKAVIAAQRAGLEIAQHQSEKK
tara:strand:- start:159 stop:773 length:615 start_codon:yes stop_codon:yes gene_type:complete